MSTPTIVILDFGGQYTQLIARRVREHHVHSIIVPPDVTLEKLRTHNAVGLVFSGGPDSTLDAVLASARHPSGLGSAFRASVPRHRCRSDRASRQGFRRA